MIAVFAKCAWRLIPFIILLYLFNFIDRVNVGFAALTMNRTWVFAAVFGLGASIFFLGYSHVPDSRQSDSGAVRRAALDFAILLAWGAVSAATAFVTSRPAFMSLRFLLGMAEAGFFPGMILYLTFWFPQEPIARASSAIFMPAIPLRRHVGGPLSGLHPGLDGIGACMAGNGCS